MSDQHDAITKAWRDYHGPIHVKGEDSYFPALPPLFKRGFLYGVEYAKRERDEARIQVKLLRVENNHNWQANDLAEQAFRERDEAREALKRITECDMRWSKKIARDALEGAK